MRIIGQTNIPFLKYRAIALTVSLLVIAAGAAYQFAGPGLNLGIDFMGGTQVTLKFRDAPDLQRIRTALTGLGAGEPVVQRFDEAEKHEVLVRVQNPEDTEIDPIRQYVIDPLTAEFDAALGGRFDLNTNGSQALAEHLAEGDPDLVGNDLSTRIDYYRPMAEAITALRTGGDGILESLDELDTVTILSDEVRSFIETTTGAGEFALLGADSVGPAVGEELRKQARLAILFALGGMLVYIWVRFQLPYGVGAVAALFHDVLITLTALALSGREINLPTVAALLTLVGYSVNDTVVVFDRVRENLRLHRGEPLEGLMNRSINQTLSRTFITSGTTLLVVLTLYFFGGDVINTFAFVLLVGILVGTYSSIFVASPVALGMNSLLVARRERRRAAARA